MKPIDEERLLELASQARNCLNGRLTVTEACTVIKAKGRVCLFVGTKAGTRIIVMNAVPPDQEKAYEDAVETNLNACREAGADETAIAIKRPVSHDPSGRIAIAIHSREALRSAIIAKGRPVVVALGEAKPGWLSALFESRDAAKEPSTT